MRRTLLLTALLVAAAFAGCTSSGDDDGLPADSENNGWVVSVTYANETQRQYTVFSDPENLDTDDDGLNDYEEIQASTDPRNIDTDADRLLDGPALCPDDGTEMHERIQQANIVEHPDRDGCFAGESRWTYQGLTIDPNPTTAFTDRSQQIDDDLDDGEEIEGWDITVRGNTYHVISNPSLRALDTDGDNLLDGAEKQLGTDPVKDDTDEDGVNDKRDAAPTADLEIKLRIETLNLKQNYRVSGGADLRLDVNVARTEASRGPQGIQQGQNDLGWTIPLSVSDEGSDFVQDGDFSYAAGNWQKPISLTFWHDSDSGSDEPIRVKPGSGGNVLTLEYDAFDETWNGDAQGGTSSGPDADVTLDVTTQRT
jgi:hypothetical protein